MDERSVRVEGDAIVWTIASDAERQSYMSLRPREATLISIVMLVTVIGWSVYVAYEMPQTWPMVALACVPLAWQLHRTYVERRHGLTSLELRFLPKALTLTEHYGPPRAFFSRKIAVFPVNLVKSLTWVTQGCYIEYKRAVLGKPVGTLPIGLFRSDESVALVQRWAESHGIPVEGIAPIIDAYQR